MAPMAPPERPLLDALRFPAALVGVASAKTVLVIGLVKWPAAELVAELSAAGEVMDAEVADAEELEEELLELELDSVLELDELLLELELELELEELDELEELPDEVWEGVASDALLAVGLAGVGVGVGVADLEVGSGTR